SQTVSVKNHKGDIGAYRYAAYATLSNGVFVGSSENNKLIETGIETGALEVEVNEEETEAKIILKDTDISEVGT
ncbi:hypothetical protein H6A03_12855, partial [[Clostridium] spiroforme]|nr:hypothetical protein [Thomasclavelia spiroformis]